MERIFTVADLDKCVCVCVLNVRPNILNVRPDVLNIRPKVLNVRPDVLHIFKHPAGRQDIRPNISNIRPNILNIRPSVLYFLVGKIFFVILRLQLVNQRPEYFKINRYKLPEFL